MLKMSDLEVYPFPSNASGAIYAAVPHTDLSTDYSTDALGSNVVTNPKSATLMSYSFFVFNKRFSGFKSLCIIPFLLMKSAVSSN
jgi:hypothetical protein